VVGLEPLDDDGGNPLLAFVEKELFPGPPVRADVRHFPHIHQTVAVAACGFDLVFDSRRQLEAADHILGRSAADNAKPARGIDHLSVPCESIDHFVHGTIAPDDDDKFCAVLDSRACRMFRIQRPRCDENGVLTADAAGDLVKDLRLPPASFAA
jgi:hypothetical protein